MCSSGLNQEGEDEEGIKGFLPDSIVKEWRRGSMLKCFYCKNKYTMHLLEIQNKTLANTITRYATVGCAHSSCKRGYHLPCGLENGSLQQFFGNFASFCSVHRPVQVKKQLCGHMRKSRNVARSGSISQSRQCESEVERGGMWRMLGTIGGGEVDQLE